MKITDLLSQNTNKVTFSFEFIPPVKGMPSDQLVEKLKPLMEFEPLFVDVTTHRHEIVFNNITPKKGTVTEGFVHKKHPSTLAVCESIRNAFGVEVMPHLLCAGFSKTDTEDLLMDLKYLGYDNVMALRGDKLPTEHNYPIGPDTNDRSSDLIEQIKRLNAGHPLDNTITDVKTDFCIGAACYPEKYYGNPCMEMEVYFDRTMKKDAHFLIAQMGFHNRHFFNFVNFLEKPVLPGIKVLSKATQCYSIPERFFVEVPVDLVNLFKRNPDEAGKIWAVKQCKELISHGYKHLHFYTMNSTSVCEVLKEIL